MERGGHDRSWEDLDERRSHLESAHSLCASIAQEGRQMKKSRFADKETIGALKRLDSGVSAK